MNTLKTRQHCSKCGAILSKWPGPTGLCKPCWLKTGNSARGNNACETGRCMMCHKTKSVPHWKDKRWFRCLDCSKLQSDELRYNDCWDHDMNVKPEEVDV
jgi:hypothetical protein